MFLCNLDFSFLRRPETSKSLLKTLSAGMYRFTKLSPKGLRYKVRESASACHFPVLSSLSKTVTREFGSEFLLNELLNILWHHSYFICDPRSFLTSNKKRWLSAHPVAHWGQTPAAPSPTPSPASCHQQKSYQRDVSGYQKSWWLKEAFWFIYFPK